MDQHTHEERTPTLGVRIDGDDITCVLYDDTSVEPLPIGDGYHLASLLTAPDRGTQTDDTTGDSVGAVSGPVRPTNEFDIDVFPRFDEQSAPDRARFRLHATRLFETLQTDLEATLTDRFSDREDPASTIDALLDGVVVSVPGVYDDRDNTDIEEALEAAGIGVRDIVRAPVSTAANYVNSLSEPSTVAAVEIGAYWCNAAIVTIDPDVPSVDVRARVVEPDLGRRAMDHALAEWALKAEQADRNMSIKPGPRALARLRDAAHEILEDGEPETIAVPGLDDVTLEVGTGPIDLNQPIESTHAAFEDISDRLCDVFRRLYAASGVNTVDTVVVAGSGSIPDGITDVVEGFFETPITRLTTELGPRSVPAAGAATIGATRTTQDEAFIAGETTARAIELAIPGVEEPRFEEIIPATAPLGTAHQIRLKTTAKDQLRGAFRLVSKHHVTGDRREIGTYTVEPLPPGNEAGDVVVEIGVIPTTRANEQNSVDVQATLPETQLDEQISSTPTVTAGSSQPDPAPWLVPVDIDLSAHELPDDRTDDWSVTVEDPIAETLDDASPRAVLETILNVRYQVWKSTQSDSPLDPDNLRKLLSLYDMGLKKMNVDIIDPDVGAEQDKHRHMIWDTEPSTKPDGEILRVNKPGYTVDGHVESPAEVIVSKGEPEQPSVAEPDTEHTDTIEHGERSDSDTTDRTHASDDSASENEEAASDAAGSDIDTSDGPTDQSDLGDTETVAGNQTGHNETVAGDQTGHGETVAGNQTGHGETVADDQTGHDETVAGDQTGHGETVAGDQTGHDETVAGDQTGHNETVADDQTGNHGDDEQTPAEETIDATTTESTAPSHIKESDIPTTPKPVVEELNVDTTDRQDGGITFTVTDSDGNPIEGARIRGTTTNLDTTTRADGSTESFSLSDGAGSKKDEIKVTKNHPEDGYEYEETSIQIDWIS